MVVHIDGFDVVLEMEFLMAHHIILMLIAGYLMIMGKDLCITPIQNK